MEEKIYNKQINNESRIELKLAKKTFHICGKLSFHSLFFLRIRSREDKGDREGIPHTHPIPQVIRLELFLRPQIPRGIRQQAIT